MGTIVWYNIIHIGMILYESAPLQSVILQHRKRNADGYQLKPQTDGYQA